MRLPTVPILRLPLAAPLTALAFLVVAGFAAAGAPPEARTVDAVERRAGLSLPDPYRWMEGEDNAEFRDWILAQGAAAKAGIEALPSLPAWRGRMQAAGGDARLNTMYAPVGERVFFLRYEGDARGVLTVREADGERVLLDPASLDTGEAKPRITQYSPSPDGRRVAVNIDSSGDEVTSIRVLDVATGEWLPGGVGPVWGEFRASWLADGSGFVYTQLAPEGERQGADRFPAQRLRLHRLDAPDDAGEPLVVAGREPHLGVRDFPILHLSPASRWALLAGYGARPEVVVCVAPAADAIAPGAPWRCLAGMDDKVIDVALHDDMLYLLSKREDPNGELLALDLSRDGATLADARRVLDAHADEVAASIAVARDAVYVRRAAMGVASVVRLAHDGGGATTLALPFAGSMRMLEADPATDGAVFSLEGWTRPMSGYRFRPADGQVHPLGLRERSVGSYDDLVSTVVEATSADGTRVPVSIIHGRHIVRDGRNRALVTGYGFGGITFAPGFSPARLEWVRAGNVYAVAHVRGGGDKGESWHRGGKGALKYKGAEDFIAAAQWLADNGYTSPERTAATGRSGGGLLMGDVITRAPERFGAFVIAVGLMNPVRMLHATNGENLVPEFGDPRTDEGLEAVAAMDPYHHVRAGTRYPPVLMSVGLKDNRVAPWHTGKFAARLRAASADREAPLWVRVDPDAGHFGGQSRLQDMLETAEEYAFLEKVLRGR